MKTKIAFVYYGDSTFVEQDYNILSKSFEVRKVQFAGIKSIYDIYKATKWADVSFCWFADVWSFIAVVSAKLLKKKSVVVIGGYDVECVKEIEYGMCTKPWWRRWMRTYTLKNATMLLAVSEYTAQKTHLFVYKDARKLSVVYNGININYFVPKGKKENIVLTVASGGNNDIIRLKGLDTFVKIAKYVRNTKFVVVGLDEKTRYELSKIAISDNIKLLGKLPQDELLKWYQRAKVYCQLSKVESFGMSLAEAMSCGCVPVVHGVGGMPEVECHTGIEVMLVANSKMVAHSIREALHIANDLKGVEAREHIQYCFSIEERERKLVQILEEI